MIIQTRSSLATLWTKLCYYYKDFKSRIKQVHGIGQEQYKKLSEDDSEPTVECPKCHSDLVVQSDNPEYEYFCYSCDEDFYGFEVNKYKGDNR